MKALVFEKYGSPDVLEIKDIEKPVPSKNEVLIKVHASTATSAEGMMRRGDSMMTRVILGLQKPKKKYRTLGLEFSGEVTETGQGVKRFKAGDRVYGFTGFSPGACAEYKCMPDNGSLGLVPDGLNHNEAAVSVDGLTTALFFLKDKAGISAGNKVLIIGASGSIGSYAVQLCRYFRAVATGVCSTKNIELVKTLGASDVIDYTKEDFRQRAQKFDIIFDTIGKSPYSHCKKLLNDKGMYLVTNGPMLLNYLRTFWSSLGNRKKFIFAMSVDKQENLRFLKQVMESGDVKPVIDRVYQMDEAREAHRYVEGGHKKGNVVINVSSDESSQVYDQLNIKLSN